MRLSELAGALMALAEACGTLTGELHEIDEALQVAHEAEEALAQVQNKLGSASNWSNYDTFFGGGTVSSWIKHSRLDEAAEEAAHTDNRLANAANRARRRRWDRPLRPADLRGPDDVVR